MYVYLYHTFIMPRRGLSTIPGQGPPRDGPISHFSNQPSKEYTARRWKMIGKPNQQRIEDEEDSQYWREWKKADAVYWQIRGERAEQCRAQAKRTGIPADVRVFFEAPSMHRRHGVVFGGYPVPNERQQVIFERNDAEQRQHKLNEQRWLDENKDYTSRWSSNRA